MTKRIFLIVAAVLKVSLCSPVQAQAAELILFPDITRAAEVSDDGKVIVALDSGEDPLFQVGRWTESTGWEELRPLPGKDTASVRWDNSNHTSGTGGTVVGTSWSEWRRRRAVLWDNEKTPHDLGSGGASGVSNDGTVVVGTSESGQAFRWTEEEGIGLLGLPLGASRSWAQSVSADGTAISVLANYEDSMGDFRSSSLFRWTAETGMTQVFETEPLLGIDSSRISDDGSAVVFYANDGTRTSTQAYRWTEEQAAVGLGWLPGTADVSGNNQARPNAINHDGSVVVGMSGSLGRDSRHMARPFIWTEQYGMEDLQQVLIEQHGIQDLPDGRIVIPYNISANGQFIAGSLWDPDEDDHTLTQAVLIRLDRPLLLLGDYNRDGAIEIGDVDLQAAAMSTADPNLPLYDENDDGIVDLLDRSIWVTEHAQTWAGDANLDQDVDFADFLSLSSGFGQAGGWAQGDFDGNGMVAFEDFLMLSDSFGNSVAPGQAAVPEPEGMLSVVVMLVIATSCRPSTGRAGRGNGNFRRKDVHRSNRQRRRFP